METRRCSQLIDAETEGHRLLSIFIKFSRSYITRSCLLTAAYEPYSRAGWFCPSCSRRGLLGSPPSLLRNPNFIQLITKRKNASRGDAVLAHIADIPSGTDSVNKISYERGKFFRDDTEKPVAREKFRAREMEIFRDRLFNRRSSEEEQLSRCEKSHVKKVLARCVQIGRR